MSMLRKLVALGVSCCLTAGAMGQCESVVFTSSSGSVGSLGPVLAGSQCDDCAFENIAAPFPLRALGATSAVFSVNSNGVLALEATIDPEYSNGPLPSTLFGTALFPFWDDLITTGAGNGIFTGVSGVSPSRVFDVRWKGVVLGLNTTADFTIRFYENPTMGDFEFFYNSVNSTTVTVGAQLGPAGPVGQFANGIFTGNGRRLTPTCQTAPFTYQGRLLVNGTPANGPHNLAFTLMGSNGLILSGPIVFNAVNVENGTFTVNLAFPGAKISDAAALRINADGTNLTPDQPLTAAPFATRSQLADYANTAPWSGLTGVPANVGFAPWNANAQGIDYANSVGIGTNSPGAGVKLDVRGEVRFGAAGDQRPVSASSENLRIVRGFISAAGVINDGSGFTIVRTPAGFAAGDWTITYGPAFAGTAVVTATPLGSNPLIYINSLSASSVRLRIVNTLGNPIDAPFCFMAVGQR